MLASGVALFAFGSIGVEAQPEGGRPATALLAGPDLMRALDASIKVMQSATRSASEFNQKAKALENEAYTFAILVQAGRDSDELAGKAAYLSDTALALAAAAKKKDFGEAKKQVAALSDFKNASKSDGQGEVHLGKAVPLANLMKVVGDVDQELKKATRLTPAAWNQKGKAEEITLHASRMLALSLAMVQHTPETDPNANKGQTSKLWKETSQETQAACLELLKAARAKNSAEFRKAYTAMDKACTRCHDVYRVEDD
jgi:cytochrome c556